MSGGFEQRQAVRMDEVARPLDLAAMPRVSRRAAAAGRAVARALAHLPARLEAALEPIGPVSIAVIGAAAVDAPLAEHVAFGLARDGSSGRLVVDARFAQHLVSAVLGSVTPPAVHRLGPGERGLLAGQIAALLDRLGVAAGLGVALAAPARVPGCAELLAEVSAGGRTGWIRFEIPPAWLEAAASARPHRTARAARLPVEARVQLAATRIPAAAWAGAAVGDGVVFDGVAAVDPAAAAPWPVRLAIGGFAADAAAAADGRVTVVDGLRPAAAATDNQKEGEMGSSDDASAALAAAPVEVVAEIGRLTLRGDEVLGLAPGVVLALAGGERTRAVALRVGGELWAHGELVDVDGELGVRITALARGS
jgi:type III secretion system YscQ/HrcQ family protein